MSTQALPNAGAQNQLLLDADAHLVISATHLVDSKPIQYCAPREPRPFDRATFGRWRIGLVDGDRDDVAA
jgi:hypothetical protein